MTSEDSRFSFRSLEPEQTRSAAAALARVLPEDGMVLNLSGGLGVGKTQFVKGLAEGLGLDSTLVTSPTFAIVNEYAGAAATPLIHMDFYRLESEMALEEVGFLDLLGQGAILAIEWGDRFANALPADRMEIQLERPPMPKPKPMPKPMPKPGDHAIAGIAGIDNGNEAPHPTNWEDKSPREFRVAALGPLSQHSLSAWRESQPWLSATQFAK